MNHKPELICVVQGCSNPAMERSNEYRTEPILCDTCRTNDWTTYDKPKKCQYCGKRKKGRLDPAGRIRCKSCRSEQMAQALEEEIRAHSHAIASTVMDFERSGTPDGIRIITHCLWRYTVRRGSPFGSPMGLLSRPLVNP